MDRLFVSCLKLSNEFDGNYLSALTTNEGLLDDSIGTNITRLGEAG